jgi:hypothetical protein
LRWGQSTHCLLYNASAGWTEHKATAWRQCTVRATAATGCVQNQIKPGTLVQSLTQSHLLLTFHMQTQSPQPTTPSPPA